MFSIISLRFYFILKTNTIHSADTGRTLEGGQDFPSFLGPMRQELEDKFGQWIKLTYSTY